MPPQSSGADPAIVARPAEAQSRLGAPITEADFGLPFYPGAVVDQASIQRVDLGGYYQLHAAFETDDSLGKVVAFYRGKLKELAPAPGALVETQTSDKMTFVLKRDAQTSSFVAIERQEGKAGSDIQLSATGMFGGKK